MCVHKGKQFCCECHYGKGSYLPYKAPASDSYSDMQMPIGYRLVTGFKDKYDRDYNRLID
jgi:hypothetical protein